ncbi:MAG: YfhO family protein [Prevotellaceae bacterium]|jgi:hypothetical protein|nr:YfhO family protein [Prevotellaceae bacterium]
MNKGLFSKLLPHIAAILLFILLSVGYFLPVLEGKHLIGHDTESWSYMAKETLDYNKTHNDVTLWTNSMFGGMPNYQISMVQPNNIMNYVEGLIQKVFPRPVFFLMLYLTGFYILLLSFRVKPWPAIVGSIAFTFASYNLIIIAAGHNSKAITIAYMAPVIGSIFMTLRWNKMLGAVLTAFFLALMIRANHIQIIYYAMIIVIFLGVVEFIYRLKNNEIKSFLQSAGLLLAAAVVALGINATTLLTTYEYSQYTMRGKSNGLTMDEQNSQQGLNKDYITQWSYGIGESMTFLIPNFKGGASGGTLDVDSKTAEGFNTLFSQMRTQGYQTPAVNEKFMKENRLPLYWGDQPGTSGPVYFGAIVCFLFVLGIFVVDKRILWWTLPVIALTLMLSWGRNFMPLTDFFIDYVPMYNKFRTVSMTLVATGFGVALMAILALKEIFYGSIDKMKLKKYTYISLAVTGGIALLVWLFPSIAGDFTSPADGQYSGTYAFLQETLPQDRKAMLRSDAFRTLLFIVLSAACIIIYNRGVLKKNVAFVLLGALTLFDLAAVDKRYLNDANFQNKTLDNIIQATPVDKMILEDTSQFRILDATVNIFNDASPSYFHKNIGGYHAAKLRRYQEMINMHIEPEIGKLFAEFNTAHNLNDVALSMDTLGVLNMLNLKYVIYNKEAAPLKNPYANGNAWFVDKLHIAENADEEMMMTGKIDTKTELVVDKMYADMLPTSLTADSAASIVLSAYKPNHLVYDFSSNTDQLAVFSEIYYDKGWNVYIDGEKANYVRANYLLRAMPLKAGNYQIEFKFTPSSYSNGNIIALISSLLLVLSIIAYCLLYLKKYKQQTTALK